jgi:hypothetical protein
MLLQAAHGPYYVFFSIYLQQNGYSSSMIGLLWSLGAGAEIIVFIVMRRLLKFISLRRFLLVSARLALTVAISGVSRDINQILASSETIKYGSNLILYKSSK